MSRGEPARAPSSAGDAVIAPDVVRFAIQKVNRLHLTRTEERQEEIAHDATFSTSKTSRSAEASVSRIRYVAAPDRLSACSR